MPSIGHLYFFIIFIASISFDSRTSIFLYSFIRKFVENISIPASSNLFSISTSLMYVIADVLSIPGFSGIGLVSSYNSILILSPTT